MTQQEIIIELKRCENIYYWAKHYVLPKPSKLQLKLLKRCQKQLNNKK